MPSKAFNDFVYWWLEISGIFLILALLTLMCLIAGCDNPTPKPPPVDPPPVDPGPEPEPEPEPEPPPEHDEYADKVLHDLWVNHNATRSQQGLKTVRPHTLLDRAAQKHANWMAANNIMDHTGEGGSSFWDRVKREGYYGRGGGENIAAGYRTADSVFNGWMNSSGHKRNILRSSWTHIGLGYAKNPRNGRLFWCAVFAYGGDDSGARELTEPEILDLPVPIEQAD